MRFILVIGIISVAFTACTSCNPPANTSRSGSTNANANDNLAAIVPTVPPEPVPSSTLDPSFKECNSYYPLIPGSQARYSLLFSSGLQATVVVAMDQTMEGGVPVFVQTLQIVDINGGVHKIERTVQKYVCDKGRIKIIAEDRDNTVEGHKTIVQMHYVDPAYVMLEPAALKPGTTWSYSFSQTFQGPDFPPTRSDRSTNPTFTVAGQEEVSVPAGKYKVIKVTKKIGKTDVIEYYAAGIGLVKRVNGDGTTWDLMSYSGLNAHQ